MNGQPSSLAVKLAARLTPKKPEMAVEIDDIILWHEREKRERIRDANKLLPSFCDNVGVLRTRDRGEFFELQLLPPEPDAPYEIQFKRYAVPGRYWVYCFRYEREGSGRVIYGSEGGEYLTKSLKLVEVDLNKPQVVELFRQAFSAERAVCRYRTEAIELLRMLAPKSKTYRETHKLCEQTMEARAARINAERGTKAIIL